MDVAKARKWLLLSSLTFTGTILIFFMCAPAMGYPLEFAQSLRLLEIILPVFLGYLGSAALFVFGTDQPEHRTILKEGTHELTAYLIKGPIIVFALALSALIIAFWRTNNANAQPGSGISVDQLSVGISLILGLLTVTTNIAVGFLFRTSSHG